MLRFLRTYNKWILVIGGTLLLVSWGLGGVLSSFSGQAAMSGAAWASVGPDGTKVTQADLESIRGELRVLDVLDDPWLASMGVTNEPAHWYLLVREAKNAGLVGGEGDARDMLDAMAVMATQQLMAQGRPAADPTVMLGNIMGLARVDQRTVMTTLAHLQGVNRLRRLYATMPRFSDTRLRTTAAETLDSLAADVLVLDARLLAQPIVPPPTTEELEKQLAAYGDKVAGAAGPASPGFGYRLPDRVKLEWIEIPVGSVRAGIETSGALDSLELKKRFASDPAKFGAQPGPDALSSFPVYEQSVRTRVLEDLTNERMAEISKFITDELAQSLRGLQRDSAYVVLPADWATRRPSLQALAQSVAEQFQIPLPIYASTGETWQTQADLRAIRGLGTATTTRFGPQPVAFPQLVDRLKEFGRGVDTMPVQKDVVGPPMTTVNRDLFFFRVIDADPSRAPRSIEEAGPTLARDVEAEDRFAALLAQQSQLETTARTEGLRALAAQFGGTVEFVPRIREADLQTIEFGVRMGSVFPGLGSEPKATREIIRKAAALPIDRPTSEIPEADRTFVIPLEHRLAMLVVRVTDLFPLTVEDYETVAAKPQLQAALLSDEFKNAWQDELGFDALKKRHQFTFARGEGAESAADGAAPAPSAG